MDDADRHPNIAQLNVGSILAGAVRLYRAAPARVASASLVVLFPLVLVSEGFHELDLLLPHDVSHSPWFLLTILPSISELLGLLGLVVLGGVMDELVGSQIRGTAQPSLAQAARALPIGRLVAADLVIALLVGFGATMGVVPGLVIAALVGIVGPVVNIEGLGPIRAVRRSIRLTWPHAWLVFGILVPAFLLEGVIHGVLVLVWDELGLAGELAVEIPLILSLGAMVVLAEVVLAYALLARDAGSPVARLVREGLDEALEGQRGDHDEQRTAGT
jgi:hypothetical protein